MTILDYRGPVNVACVAFIEHDRAVVRRRYTSKMGAPFRHMLEGWANMAEAHRRAYSDVISADYYIGPIWEDMARSLRSLLSADVGGFDCGSIDRNILEILAENGVDTEGW